MRPDATQRLRLIAVLTLVMAPHVMRVPIWVSALALAVLGWQALAAVRGWRQPGRVPRLALAGLAFAAVYAGFGRVDGQNAGVALLMLMLALKLTETNRHRDVMVLLSLCFFLLITHFLFSQEIVMIGFLAVGALLITACFVDTNHPQGALPTRTILSTAAMLLAHALPVAALLFVLFPRIPGPLWGLPSDNGASARSGLSDTMAPGAISRVALSDTVAFRVRFHGDAPPSSMRYWRGPVFWAFDGRRWSRGNPGDFSDQPSRSFRGQATHYRLTLEPHRRDWLPALDLPANGPSSTYVDIAGNLRTRESVTAREAYELTSYPRHRLQTGAPGALLDYARRLPESGNPRARSLAAQWHDSDRSPHEIVDAALRRFREQPYHYTLQPQAVSGHDRIDHFLFETREGFCEHYAGAFTFLMRAAGIPARVVTGYQGGQAGTGGDYFIIRDADAHAWSEVWLAGRGWVRVDPTSAVSPARIDSGLGASLGESEPVPYLARGTGGFLYQIRLGWDFVNAAWNRWFLAYGPRLQNSLMRHLGLPDLRAMILALTVLITAFLGILSIVLARRTHPGTPHDPVQAAWLRFCRRLAGIGITRRAPEGPLDYAERVARERPREAAVVRDLARRYARLRYRGGTQSEREYFIRAARTYHPHRD